MRRMVLAAVALAAVLAVPAQAAGPEGAISQLAGDPGCYSDDGNAFPGPGACTNARGIDGTFGGALSPDGRFLYVANYGDAVLVFSRDTVTGALTQLSGHDGCVSQDGTLQTGDEGAVGCADGRALADPFEVVVSPDGAFVYVAGGAIGGGEIAVFSRNATTGVLTQLPGAAGCLSHNGTASADPDAIGCVDGRGLVGISELRLSPDGVTLYAPGFELGQGSVAVLRRDPTTGALSQSTAPGGCLSESGTAFGDPGALGCSNVRAMATPGDIAISPDGSFAYVQSTSYALSAFSVDQASGALTQLSTPGGCYTNDGVATSDPEAIGCVDVRSIGEWQVAVSPDGKNVYTTNMDHDVLAAFARDATTGELTQLAGTAGCLSEDGAGYDPGDPAVGCIDARALGGASSLLFDPTGRQLFSGGFSHSEWAVLDRDPTTGALSQSATATGCVSEDGTATGDAGALGCADVRGLGYATDAALSPDGHSLYLFGWTVAAFERQVAPVCANATASTAFQTPVEITLSCSDANSDALTVTPLAPGHGTLGTVSAGKVTYTPAAGFSGADAFTFSASDGTNSSNAATAALTVAAKPTSTTPPVATPPPVTTPPVTTPPTQTVGRPGLVGRTVRVDRQGHLALKLSCSAGQNQGPCTGRVTLRTAGAVSAAKQKKRILVLATKGYNVAAGKTATVRVTLNARGKRLIKAKKKMAAIATFTLTGKAGKVTSRLTLKRA
jgi:DNA-binding beta-propeller fold protein YncE